MLTTTFDPVNKLFREEDLIQLANRFMRNSQKMLKRNGRIVPTLYSVSTDPENDGGSLIGKTDLRDFMSDVDTKNLLNAMGPEILSRMHAYAYAITSEGWFMASNPIDNFESDEEKKEAVEKIQKERNKYKSMEDMPGRKECIFMYYETYSKSKVFIVEIVRRPKGSPKFKQLDVSKIPEPIKLIESRWQGWLQERRVW